MALPEEALQTALGLFLGPRLTLLSTPIVSDQFSSGAIVDDEPVALSSAAAKQVSIGKPILIEPDSQLPDFRAFQPNRAGLSVAGMIIIARPPTEIRLDRIR